MNHGEGACWEVASRLAHSRDDIKEEVEVNPSKNRGEGAYVGGGVSSLDTRRSKYRRGCLNQSLRSIEVITREVASRPSTISKRKSIQVNQSLNPSSTHSAAMSGSDMHMPRSRSSTCMIAHERWGELLGGTYGEHLRARRLCVPLASCSIRGTWNRVTRIRACSAGAPHAHQ